MSSAVPAFVALAMLTFASAAPCEQPNWDAAWWGMSQEQFATRYPGVAVVDGEAWVPVSQISRAAPGADLIEPGSRVRFYFDQGGAHLRQIEVLSAHTYDDVMPLLQREFGRQSEGEDSEANCFDGAGQRIATDPSGVGHVLAICMGAAVFLDREHGIRLTVTAAGGAPDRFRVAESAAPYQFITMRSIDD
jgi:hypothetical protein